MIRLKVPATTANLGSGFDTLGMALSLYNIDSDALRKACEPHKDKVKGLMTNYPKAMLNSISW